MIAISPLFPAAPAELVALGFLHSAGTRPETVDVLGSILVNWGLILLTAATLATAVVTTLLARRDSRLLIARGAAGQLTWGLGVIGGIYLNRRAQVLSRAGARAIAPANAWWAIVASVVLILMSQYGLWVLISLHHTFSGA